MKALRSAGPSAALALRSPRPGPGPERSDRRRGGDLPVPDLLEVVLRVQQAAPRRADQLPVDRLGRRHPAAHQPDGLLRRHRRPDDPGAAAGGARRDPPPADGARRRRADLQHPGRRRGAQVHRQGARRHHSSARSRSGTIPRSRRRTRESTCPAPTSRSSTARTARARPTSSWTTSPRSLRSFKKTVGVATSVNWPVGLGGKGNEGVAGLVKQTPGSIGYVELIYAIQNKIDYGSVQNMAGRVRPLLDRLGDRGRGRAPPRRCRPTSASRSPTPRARASIRSPPSPGSCSTRTRRTRQKSKVMVDFVKWALTDGQKYAKDLGYAPLPGGGRPARDGSLQEDQGLASGARERSR